MSSWFSGLRDKARSLLGKTEGTNGGATVGSHTDAVPRDRLDDVVFDNVRSAAPGMQRMTEKLAEDHSYTEPMLRDMFTALLAGGKPAGGMRMAAEMAPSHRPNVAIEKEMMGTREWSELGTICGGDEYDTALALMTFEKPVGEALERTREAREKAEEAQRQRDEARQQAEQAKREQQNLDQAEQTAEEKQRQAEQQQAQAEQAQQQAESAAQAAQADPSNAEAQAAAAAAQAAAEAAQQAAEKAAAQADAAGQSANDHAVALEQVIAAAEAALAEADQSSHRAELEAAACMADMHDQLATAVEEATKDRDDERSLFEAFGYGPGELQRMSFEERMSLAQQLKGSRLARFHELIGGFRLMEAAERRRKTQHGHSEVHGIELGNDLSRLLPSELVAMATPELEDDFWRRFTQHQLMNVRYRGSEKVGRGAIVAVVDESGTMSREDMVGGASREAYSKAMCLAMLDRARAQGRDFVYIGFSAVGQQHIVRFPKGQGSLADVMEMTEHFYNGGTHFETPLEMARSVIESDFTEQKLAKADVMFLTDGQAPISPGFVERWNELRERAGFRCWGVAVSAETNTQTIERVCDTTRAISEFTSSVQANADVFQAL